MTVIKWAAVAVTLLMGLANLGQIAQDTAVGWKVLSLVLATAALVAIVGFIARRRWGTIAVIALGAVNLGAAITAAVAGFDGWPIGVVLSTLAVVLGTVHLPASRSAVTA